MFAGLANLVTRHSKAVIAVWVVVVLCALPLGLQADDKLEYELTNMVGTSSEAAQGNELMEKNFSNSIGMDEVLVIKYPTSQESDAVKLGDAFSALVHSRYPSVTATSVGSYHSDGSDYSVLLYSITSTDSGFLFTERTGDIRNVVSDAKVQSGVSLTTYVTGDAALTYDTKTAADHDVEIIDVLSVVLVFVLLALFFGALATAVFPPLGFGAAFAVALLAIYAVGSVTGVYYLSKTLVTVTMLGAGCDYGIFIITRYREELKKGADHHSALTTSVEWAGESVFTSGMSVIIGFACLAICDFQLVRTMGIVLALGIVFALVSALTFVPAVVNLVGEKVFWPNSIAKYKGVEDGTNYGVYARASRFFGRYFKWVSRVTRRYSKPIVVLAVLISLPTMYVYATSSSSYDMISVEPDAEAKEGLYAIMDQTYGGTLMPTYVVVEFENTSTEKIGKVSLPTGTDAPYLQWSAYGLTKTSDSYTGYVPAIMTISDDITSKNASIVAETYGLNSWQVLFGIGQKTALTQYYETAYPSILEMVKASHPDWTEEQQKAEASAETSAVAVKFVESEAGIDTINSALVDRMPSNVQSYISAYVAAATSYAKAAGTTATPELVLGTDGTTKVTLANLIDYVLNVGTGLLSDDGKAVSLMIVTKEKPMSDNTMDFVATIKDAFHGTNGYDSTYSSVIKDSKVCGTNAIMYDVSGTVSSQFTVIQIVVVVLLLILLFFILGCYLTPIRAMVCIVLSVIWTLALTYVVFQNLVDVPVCWIVPIVLFVVLLGLGMDYDIFITTRVRENKVRGMSNDDAIDSAICSASGVISLCALIMGGTFLTLLLGSSSMLWEFGFALGVGILIDGLFMVTYVGPAVMHLMGEWSWKGPRFLQRKHVEAPAEDSVKESQ